MLIRVMTSLDNRKLNRIASVLVALILVSCAAAALVGCGGKAASGADSYTVDAEALSTEGIEPTDTFVVCAVVRGQAFKLPGGALAYAKAGIEGERYVGVVLADGSRSLNGMRYELGQSTQAGRKKEIRRSTQDYIDYACSLRASTAGISLLESINAAANELHAKGSGSMTICVVTSGVSDGAAATSPELLGADAGQIVSQLIANGSIANYDGITIRFYGIGQSTGEQVIPDSTASSLKAFWEAVVVAGGGHPVFCTDVLTPLGCDSALPTVQTYSYPADELVIPQLSPSQTADVVLGDDVLTFEGDSDEFADPVRAQEVLAKYANALRDSGYTVSIAGYTADSPARTSEFLQDLSERRAQAVSRGLIGNGVSESSITAVRGYGSEGSSSMATGTFDEAQASRDRKVVLTLSSPASA